MRTRVTLGVGSPYLLGMVTLLGGPTFCHVIVNTRGSVTLLEGSTSVGSDYCQITKKLGVFLLGDTTARPTAMKNCSPRGKRKENYRQNTQCTLLIHHIWLFCI